MVQAYPEIVDKSRRGGYSQSPQEQKAVNPSKRNVNFVLGYQWRII
jgi:hypothetical protein